MDFGKGGDTRRNVKESVCADAHPNTLGCLSSSLTEQSLCRNNMISTALEFRFDIASTIRTQMKGFTESKQLVIPLPLDIPSFEPSHKPYSQYKLLCRICM